MQSPKPTKFTNLSPLSPTLQLYNNLKKIELETLKRQNFVLKDTLISLLLDGSPNSQNFVLKDTLLSLLLDGSPNSQRHHITNSKNPTLLYPSPLSH